MAGTDLRASGAFHLRRRTSVGKPAAARRRPSGRPPRVAECAPDGGRTEALSIAAGPLPDRGGGPAQGRVSEIADELFRFVLCCFRSAAGSTRAVRRNPAGLSGAAPDGPDNYSLLFKIPARGDDFRLAIYVNLPEGTNDVLRPRGFNGGAYSERRTIRRNGGLRTDFPSMAYRARPPTCWCGSKVLAARRKPNGFRRRTRRSLSRPYRAPGKSPRHICGLGSNISFSD